jgi:hypothetical protein
VPRPAYFTLAARYELDRKARNRRRLAGKSRRSRWLRADRSGVVRLRWELPQRGAGRCGGRPAASQPHVLAARSRAEFPLFGKERAAERAHCNAPRPGSKARDTPEHCGLRGLIAHRGRLRGASTQLVAPRHARRHSIQKGDARRIVTDASETPTIARWRDFRGPARWEGTGGGKPRQRARLGAAD